ncbi:CGH_3_HP_G0031900.mRNA.1.CDS.1 [Saccharomyces cerevisiae]|nr:CGH_3_HP_G0031900.mRNA.1.CDS.1 [Saccharomyces cerevisiae]CAI6475244.1 CGH_3_HP_G0031900.mRNA.1.CDS.1 [Saccharomyces cerevisiae]
MNKRYKLYRVWYYYAHQTVCITSTGFALCFVVQAKTAGLGVTPITSLYGDKKEHLGKLLVPLVLYQVEQVMTANFFVSLFKRWIQKDDFPFNLSFLLFIIP